MLGGDPIGSVKSLVPIFLRTSETQVMAEAADLQILLGVMALQNGLVEAPKLEACLQDWKSWQGRPLTEILGAIPDCDPEVLSLLQDLVEYQLKRHGGSAARSLACLLSTASTVERLAQLGDPELTRSASQLGAEITEPGSSGGTQSLTRSLGGKSSGEGRFRLLRCHAQGGLGAVFVALDTELHREVAVKQILERHADDEAYRQRFLREAEITGGLEHPGVVPVYGLGVDHHGRPFYAMRFIRGASLSEAIRRYHGRDFASDADEPGGSSEARSSAVEGGPDGPETEDRPLRLRKLLRSLQDVCYAIDYAHARGVLHRDLKPSNIIVGKYGETLVVDWGLARFIGDGGTASGEARLSPPSASGSAETLPGSALGTPAYMSPEQAAGDLARLGSWSDVYSLGATLYQILTGRPPFEGTTTEVLRAVQTGRFAPPRSIDPGVDRALEAICLKAMATRPEDRYQTARELAEDIDRWMADEPIRGWREPFWRRAGRWVRRHRTPLLASGAAAAALLVGLIFVATVQASANRQLRAANLRESSARASAQERFELALDAIRANYTGVSEDVLLREPEQVELRRKLLRNSLEFSERLAAHLDQETELDATSRKALAEAMVRIAEITNDTGSKTEALEAARRGVRLWEQLAADHPQDSSNRRFLIQALGRLARIQAENGHREAALQSHQQALELAEELAAQDDQDVTTQTALAGAVLGQGTFLAESGAIEEAVRFCHRAERLYQELIVKQHDNANHRANLSQAAYSVARILAVLGKNAESLAAFEGAIARQEDLVRDFPKIGTYRHRLSQALLGYGLLQWRTRNLEAARRSFKRAQEVLEILVREHPTITEYQGSLAACYGNLGILESEAGRMDSAIAALRLTRGLLRKLVRDNPSFFEFQRDLATTYNNLGYHLYQSGHLEAAAVELEEGLRLRRELLSRNPDVSQLRRHVVRTLYNLGLVYRDNNRPAEAIRAFDESQAIATALPDAGPADLIQAAACWIHRAQLGGEHAGPPRLALDRAMELIRKALDQEPGIREEIVRAPEFTALEDYEEYRDLLDQGFPDDPFAD
jgi:serine/threonine protein kinase